MIPIEEIKRGSDVQTLDVNTVADRYCANIEGPTLTPSGTLSRVVWCLLGREGNSYSHSPRLRKKDCQRLPSSLGIRVKPM